jgi:hypothetical protein
MSSGDGGWYERTLSNGVALLTFAGVFAYALGRVCYIAFYAAFGISPDEVGIDQARSVETAGLLLVAAVIVAAAFWLADAANERRGVRWRVLGFVALTAYVIPVTRFASLGDNVAFVLPALLVIVFGFFTLEVGLAVVAGRRETGLRWSLNAPQLVALSIAMIASGSVVTAWQFGLHAAHAGRFEASPFSAIRIDPVCVSWLTTAPAVLRPDRPYVRLGSANGIVVLYDAAHKAVVRIPETVVVLVASGHHARCP